MADNASSPSDQNGSGPAAVAAPGGRAGALAALDEPRTPWFRRPLPLTVLLVVVLGVATAGVLYWLHARQFEETDDAFIDGDVVPVGNKVPGTVQRVWVNDNQDVTRGQLLVTIDAQDLDAQVQQATGAYDAAQAKAQAASANAELTRVDAEAGLAQAQAGVEQANAAVKSAESQVASSQADVTAAQAEAQRRQADLKRYEALDPRSVSQQQLDTARAAANAAEAQLLAAQKRVAFAQAQIVEARAKVGQAQASLQAANTVKQQVAAAEAQARNAEAVAKEAEAALKQATLSRSYAEIHAPVAGRVTRKNVEPGQYLQVGHSLLAIVQPDVWVVANFKETQLTHMRAGQDAEIKVDAYPGKVFHGKVDSIQAGTGARFSMFPPENATGNFVKVVQRVPVKITIDNDPEAKRLLGLGMSVVPSVRITSIPNEHPMPITEAGLNTKD